MAGSAGGGARAAQLLACAACAAFGRASAALPRAPVAPGADGDGAFPLPYLFAYPDQYPQSGRFPANFTWGAGTAAYQVEGGWDADGKGASIWDTFTGTDGAPINPGMVDRGQTGAIACDSYHRAKDDVALLVRLGLSAYRFSISWPRLLPNGTLVMSGGAPNMPGVDYYNALIDELLRNRITPYVTLYHWDLPQALLHDPYAQRPSRDNWRGWLDDRLPGAFAQYAELCFSLFGDRVKHWITLNEPFTFAVLGHSGPHAPSLCNWEETLGGCSGGPRPAAGWDVYVAGHHALLAHALVAKVYREKYRAAQGGELGVALSSYWYEPASHMREDVAAAERALAFELGWFAQPLTHGSYPRQMRDKLGARLPAFSAEEAALLAGSTDFFALNLYSALLVRDKPPAPGYGAPGGAPVSQRADCDCETSASAAWPRSNATWLRSVPWALRKMLRHVHARYAPAAVYVTENGWADSAASFREGAHDEGRISFLANYTAELWRAANEDGVPVRGYFVWSLLDNFEWEHGFSLRYGVTFVDFHSARRTRYAKTSACWLRALATGNALVPPSAFAEGLSSRRAARRAPLDVVLAGRHALPAWMRAWEAEGDELDLCDPGFFLRTPFSMDFLDSFDFLFALLVVACVCACVYVNLSLLADLKQLLVSAARAQTRRAVSVQADDADADSLRLAARGREP
ncbi:hypothetical protein KFE25_010474 [Diacronema lutheri]|uniref:Beta-glucosidase n=1 Tax=Diacronema lutheri TaxID=2081491 RepID=A0A8J6C416_DIALT|nr:hypothetical protein KFE25_010474 [Diacronema lutheri]